MTIETKERQPELIEASQPAQEAQVPAKKDEQKKPALEAGSKPAAIVPRNIEECFRLADAIYRSNMAPNSYKSAEQVLVGIMKGLELNMMPLTALQSIYVVNGTPTVWGDGALALVRASGLVEDFEETFDAEKEIAVCRIKRKDQKTEISRKFDKEDATRAGLLNKTGPWNQYRPRMYQMRARSLALRDGFADVLRGLRITEEVADFPGNELVQAPDGSFIVKSSVQAIENPLDDEPAEQGTAE